MIEVTIELSRFKDIYLKSLLQCIGMARIGSGLRTDKVKFDFVLIFFLYVINLYTRQALRESILFMI